MFCCAYCSKKSKEAGRGPDAPSRRDGRDFQYGLWGRAGKPGSDMDYEVGGK